MEKIVLVDLERETIVCKDYSFSTEGAYGRALGLRLLEEYSNPMEQRTDEKNVLVIVPGLLTGNKVPCATRALLMARGDGNKPLLVSNFTGELPQKLASLQIAAIVIRGKSEKKNMVLLIDGERMVLQQMQETQGMPIPEMISLLREIHGKDSAIWGVGKAADFLMPESTYFYTYPEGIPSFSCPRNGFGDVIGSKGLRAIVVKESNYFGAFGEDLQTIQACGKTLAKQIVADEICGGALPGLGSITLLHVMKNREQLPMYERGTGKRRNLKKHGKINSCCAPMCVIGCLNRHSAGSDDVYGSPADSEVRAALQQHFGEVPLSLAKDLNEKGFAIGLDMVEFVHTVALYLFATNQQQSPFELFSYLEEIEQGTVMGRLLGGGTKRVYSLFRDVEGVKQMVTRAAVSKEKDAKVKLKHFETEQEEDLDLLYERIYILENLGICIFSSFAILNDQSALELLAQMVSAKLGKEITLEQLMFDARRNIQKELEFSKRSSTSFVEKTIPEFVKVLYAYFEK